jgi:hypothetical protein
MLKNAITVAEMQAAYQEVMNGFTPEVMIWAFPEGTWLIKKGEEPVLLGEEKDFESIWHGMLGIRSKND